jgi:hypothetical protein
LLNKGAYHGAGRPNQHATPRHEPDAALIDDILVSARRNNRRDSLTGLLVVG